jgi:hypothetical protein
MLAKSQKAFNYGSNLFQNITIIIFLRLLLVFRTSVVIYLQRNCFCAFFKKLYFVTLMAARKNGMRLIFEEINQ